MAEFSDGQKFQLWRVKNFFEGLNKQARKDGHFETTAFDSISSDIMCYILNKCTKNGQRTIKCSSYELANVTASTRSRIRTRITCLARFGLLTVKNSWRMDGTKNATPWRSPHTHGYLFSWHLGQRHPIRCLRSNSSLRRASND